MTNISEIQACDTETWRIIPGYGCTYAVSNYGSVMNLKRNRRLNPIPTTCGYLQVTLCFNGQHKKIVVHRLVAHAFIPNPHNYPEINHLDLNKANNRVENLEWCTHQQNIHHAAKRGKMSHSRQKETIEAIKQLITDRKMNQKNVIDTRSFPEICNGLSQLEKETLCYALIKRGCTTTRQTVWNWTTGNTQPNHPLIKKQVADVVGKIIGSRVLPDTLFPTR